MMSQPETPDELRERARSIRQMAQYASGACYYDEMHHARELDRKAKELEELNKSRKAELDRQAKELDASNNAREVREKNAEKRRKKLIAKIKIAQKQLGLDDDTYRDLLQNTVDERSAADLKFWQLERVVHRMLELGFKPKPPAHAGSHHQAKDKQSRYIRSLWIQLHEAGKVSDPSESALLHWVTGQIKTSRGIEALQWLSKYQKSNLIESLKKWLYRK